MVALKQTGPSLVVVGGGITGLAAAYGWKLAIPAGEVTVLEAAQSAGGKLRTEQRDGFQVEAGADSFLDRDGAIPSLCADLAVGPLRSPAIFGAMVRRRGRLVRLPPSTVMGVPSSIRSVLRSPVLSVRGKLRALFDLLAPGPLRGDDVAVADFIGARFGREVMDRLVDPVLAGTRAGDPGSLSLAAALPQIDEVARSHRSVLRGLGRWPRPGAPSFLAPEAGMSRLVDAFVTAIGASAVVTGAPVTELGRDAGGWAVATADGTTRRADAVIVATPAYAAAPLIADLASDAAAEIEGIAYASSAVVTLAYDRPVVTPGGSGLLLGSHAAATITAATWYSKKWPHAAPPEKALIRTFVGRAGADPALEAGDETLINRVAGDLTKIAGIREQPAAAWVTRWNDGLPQYAVGHRDRVTRARVALRPHGGLELAGAAYDGSGVPDCIASGLGAARRAAQGLLR
ncbi:MAG: protoporphyrinogen oxidase [Actinomycetota bacterium]